MGLFEEYQQIMEKNNFLVAIKDYVDFNHKGLFSKKISLEFKVESEQPFTSFYNKKEKLYFVAHDLEIGEKIAMRWHLSAQQKGVAQFSGFVNILHPKYTGALRGVLEFEKEKYGIYVQDHRLLKAKAEEELFAFQYYILDALHYSMTASQKQSKSDDSI